MDRISQLNAALVGRYEIHRELGAGGMARVFLARDVKHQRQVAVKVLHDDLAVSLGAERFLAEIRTTANLQHPHILPLHDSGEVGMTNVQVLQLATVNAARLLGMEGRVGVLKQGAFADLIALDGDPAKDILALARPVFVMVKGAQVLDERH